MTTRKKAKRVGGRSRAMSFLDGLVGEPMSFGHALRVIRETDDLTQSEIARRVGVTRAHVCDIEKGRKLVSPERAVKFAKALGYNPEQLVRLALQDQLRAAGLSLKVRLDVA